LPVQVTSLDHACVQALSSIVAPLAALLMNAAASDPVYGVGLGAPNSQDKS